MINSINYKLRKEDIDLTMPLTDRLLIARDLNPLDLKGDFENLYDPYLINDMEIAVSRILRAKK